MIQNTHFRIVFSIILGIANIFSFILRNMFSIRLGLENTFGIILKLGNISSIILALETTLLLPDKNTKLIYTICSIYTQPCLTTVARGC